MPGSASTNTMALPTAAKRRRTTVNVRFSIESAGRQENDAASVMQPPMPMRIGGGRIRKARVLFDPSENNFPRRRQTTPAVSTSKHSRTPSRPPTVRIAQPTAASKQSPLKRRLRKPSEATKKGQLVKCQLCQLAIGDGTSKQSSGPQVGVCVSCNQSRVHKHCYRSLRPDVDAEMVSWKCADCTYTVERSSPIQVCNFFVICYILVARFYDGQDYSYTFLIFLFPHS